MSFPQSQEFPKSAVVWFKTKYLGQLLHGVTNLKPDGDWYDTNPGTLW